MFLPMVLDVVLSNSLPNILSSFDDAVLQEFYRRAPEVSRIDYALTETRNGNPFLEIHKTKKHQQRAYLP